MLTKSVEQPMSYGSRIISPLIILVCCNSCSINTSRSEAEISIVSIVQLLSFPGKYSGRRIQVKGYLLNGYFYLNKDSAKITRDISMAIHIAEPSEGVELTTKCNDSYATVTGVFKTGDSAWRLGESAIDPVESVLLMNSDNFDCWQSK